jgi:dsDNA-specific endonuclease/ATPase MutS2
MTMPHEDPPDEPVVIPIEDALDLHPFAPREIPDVVDAYLEAAVAAGLAEVRLVHGKGLGVQRHRVHTLLATHRLVRGFREATPERGGAGATVVTLAPTEGEK